VTCESSDEEIKSETNITSHRLRVEDHLRGEDQLRVGDQIGVGDQLHVGDHLRVGDHLDGQQETTAATPHLPWVAEDRGVSSTEAKAIPVEIRPRQERPPQELREVVFRKIMRNSRVAKSQELPTIATTNMRSIGPKIRNFTEDILQREITACFVSETWQKDGSKKFEAEIERMFELFGLKFVSCSRPSNKRGGGAAIVVDTTKFSCEKLN
jgi:hypothetical protein